MAAPRHRIGSLPFPGPKTIYTLADPDDLGMHRYQVAIGAALSPSAEAQRGTIYTCRAGFLDMAHLRLSVDWMRYAHVKIERAMLKGKTEASFVGPDDEIVHISIVYPPVWDEIPEGAKQRALDAGALRGAARASYLIWTWHEAITHEGHSTFLLISERGSAFGYDDMTSHAVGLAIGSATLADERPFNEAATEHLASQLEELGVVSRDECAEVVGSLEGVWWERSGPLMREFDAGLASGRMGVRLVPGVAACPGARPAELPVPFGAGASDPTLQPKVEITIQPGTGAGRSIAKRLGRAGEPLDAEAIDEALRMIAAEHDEAEVEEAQGREPANADPEPIERHKPAAPAGLQIDIETITPAGG